MFLVLKTLTITVLQPRSQGFSLEGRRGGKGPGNEVDSVKVGFYLKAVFPSPNLGIMGISRSRFKQSKNCSLIPRIYVLRSFVNFWVIFGDIWEEIVFINGSVKLRELRNGED